MTRPFPSIHPPARAAVLVLALLITLCVFAVLIHAVTARSVPGADFYTFWVAGRALYLEHGDPYSQAVTEQAQMGKLGRLAGPDEDQMAYAYPPYALLAVLPLVFLPVGWAVSFWLALNILAFLVTLFIALPPPMRSFGASMLLIFHVLFNFILGTFDILIGCGILLFFGLIAAQNNRSRGVQVLTALLLAWGTIKPQFLWLSLALILVYAVHERLKPFLITFFTALAFFLVISFLLVPGWAVEWPARVQEYTRYVQGQPVLSEFLDLFLPAQASLGVAAALFAACMLVSAWILLKWWRGEIHWTAALAWMGMLTYLFHLHGISYEQLVFLLPLVLWIGLQKQWRTWPVLVFWSGSILISWLALVFGMHSIPIDRSPVLWNAVWVAWLFLSRTGRIQV